ncbi:multi-sensor signal transduction histidine kinase [Rippkaea orientalis PCC 8801]|uniref:histidine kinase n=1 Tax=Rippkaea orientalis (strain PCC 8801 / RF-1) TaxID=41431 RepID=B7K5Z0_RIPO1|nr:ATP-binding protein [Rippkaea orientalis]ACK68043.1 multi-sensor signal transduction histidine kinase [Rippkaea orientalis PCC 8801]
MIAIQGKTQDINLSKLDEAPIHLWGQIQPHGVLFVLEEPSLKIVQTSNNTQEIFGIAPEKILDQTLDDIFDPFQIEQIKNALFGENLDFVNPTKLWARVQGDEYVIFDGIFHRNASGYLILELEPAISQENIPFLSFYHLAKASINELQSNANLREFCQIIVKEVRQMTGFDRVMLYKFDEQQHGDVIAENKLENLEPYLGLRYPASDIPLPARRLFCSNSIRIIPDAKAKPVQLFPINNPLDENPVDLTLSILRSASGCHLEYLRNMGVGASLTISLIKDGELWGLIACHHQTPKYVPYEVRKACEFLGRVVFAEISAREETEDYDYRMKLTAIQSGLVDAMSLEETFVEGLVKDGGNLLNLTSAQGAAICIGDNCQLVGRTPKEEDIKYLVQWLKKNVNQEVFYTDSLPHLYADARNFKEVASGLLAVTISQRNYVLWFRPEVIQTVNWGGDPSHVYEAKTAEGTLQLSPRKSFELWKETVRLKSLPWKPVEIKAVLELKKAITNIILRQADELAQLAHDLELSNSELKKFAYVASHDLQEPLNQVSNYVQLLEMRYGESLDEDASEFINFAVEGVSLMQTLIDDVLAYSKVDMRDIEFELTESEIALERALANLRGRITQTEAIITHDPLPTVMADSTQLMQLFLNLIGNAIKFRSEKPPEIHIGAKRLEDAWLFSVKDNGMGIDPQYSERIFVIFQRLHTRDEYPGTGMGLAICKKILECHRGCIWVESELGQGATFYFTIPVGGRDRNGRRGRSQ